MTIEQSDALVFKDQAGEYYLLPNAALEQGRIPEEHKAELERLLAEVDGDVSGYYMIAIAPTLTLSRVNNTDAEGTLLKWIEQKLVSGGPA